MRIGNDVEIQMYKGLRKGIEFDEAAYVCKLLSYDAKKERLVLLLQEDVLTQISLDVIYRCTIWDEDDSKYCLGRVKQRYHCAQGSVLEVQIEDGFYKINVNSVDKKESEC